MPSQRAGRLREALKEEVSAILHGELKDPRIGGMVSVTDVELTPDLTEARVYVSILGSEEDRRGTLAALASAAGFVRQEIGRRMRLRRVPEIEFRFDPSIERGARIQQLLREAGTPPEGARP